jgi:hypothetical protein
LTQAALFEEDTRGAAFSPCKRYRYRLWRQWAPPGRIVLFVMLNPSIAGATLDDATIRRCLGFAKRWGYARLEVCNLFGWRATDPKRLLTADDPVGNANDVHLVAAAVAADLIIAAWGASLVPATHAFRADQVLQLLARPVHCLGLTKESHPVHPLRQPAHLNPVPFWSPPCA